jgi:hypothetical protein
MEVLKTTASTKGSIELATKLWKISFPAAPFHQVLPHSTPFSVQETSHFLTGS